MTAPFRPWSGLVVALALLVTTAAACGTQDVAGRPAGSSAESSARTVVLGAQPRDYRARVRASCGERSFLGAFDVVVRDGTTTQVRPIGRARLGRPDGVPLDAVPTMDEMATLAREADDGQLLDLVFDEEGRVRRVEIDHRPSGVDDEECYSVSRLRVRPAPGGR